MREIIEVISKTNGTLLSFADKKNYLEIPYNDISLDDEIESLKQELSSDDIFTIKTKRGILESKIRAAAPTEIIEFLDYTKYAAVFIITSYFGGMIGQAGADRYKKIVSWIQKLKNKGKNVEILLISDIERTNDFPLKVCFLVKTRSLATDLNTALNSIPSALGTIKREILRYQNKHALLITFTNGCWNTKTPQVMRTNRGSTVLSSVRSLKLHGICESKYFPKEQDLTEWEILNSTIPAAAEKNALKHRSEYYQRLYTTEEIKYAIYRFHSASISIDIFESIISAPKGNVPLPQLGEKPMGQHCVAALGYNSNGVQFVNSWGNQWGENGMGYFSWEYIDKYLIEAWTWKSFLSIPTWNQIINIKLWRSFIKDKKDRKLICSGFWQDKRSMNVFYEILRVPAINPYHGNFFVINLFDNREQGKKKGGWLHFSVKDTQIEIEDLFVDIKNRNSGWAKKMLEILVALAKSSNIKKIVGWVSAEDTFDEYTQKGKEKLFRDCGFLVTPDTTKFRGSVIRIDKIIF